MDIEKIEQIIKVVKDYDVKKFKYKNFDDEIEIDFTEEQPKSVYSNYHNQNNDNETVVADKNDSKNDTHSDEGEAIKSPMVGTFFLQDSKELTEPKIKVGDTVNKGDVIGYIEAMKVLNEVTTNVSGEVVEIVVDHGTNVEYDQVLVRVK
ncbi:acetyl-CoA carboxylase biotin carboxyl carrier protein [Staphylococcus argenteus]|uniref:acetyl-CoA carboxylase biotin carboxyl carrier protein n=1 Tax=Staphylococcus argenteus TaxID=985002 RepID=UPI000233FEFA|nr:biotin/lipoyl-containing protein [Staphylococcus argenteus]MBE2131839.1 acetyl-CoA carboxylase biotin carboxyl carrier protein subunit [Staphylococcus argenteus]MBE2134275.1 acetyl-CoA carboxylase biotin carboxyl carrier protein subunit [Staphylococcus argenteus]MBE2136141.1 acetyl-CoA carboxylase biotin carboxyl carrier protein subunit [Staphylococcus argenteus]MBE2145900.1 acetyl-CoA carboxylase biotin carboxyl carrier protein subunit [Staphylococcus argenteus]MBE2161415.1 acetyl-CoA carb